MKKYLPLFLLIAVLFLANDAYAQVTVSGGSDIYDKLAIKAGFVGNGLRRSGFIIAGLGMIVFTFMAIFNKLQWKHLAYIMFSTAVLSGMIALITEIRSGGSSPVNHESLAFSNQGYKMSDAEGGTDARSVPVSR